MATSLQAGVAGGGDAGLQRGRHPLGPARVQHLAGKPEIGHRAGHHHHRQARGGGAGVGPVDDPPAPERRHQLVGGPGEAGAAPGGEEDGDYFQSSDQTRNVPLRPFRATSRESLKLRSPLESVSSLVSDDTRISPARDSPQMRVARMTLRP